jgi:hypothetical protein
MHLIVENGGVHREKTYNGAAFGALALIAALGAGRAGAIAAQSK